MKTKYCLWNIQLSYTAKEADGVKAKRKRIGDTCAKMKSRNAAARLRQGNSISPRAAETDLLIPFPF